MSSFFGIPINTMMMALLANLTLLPLFIALVKPRISERFVF